jgi:hypothetical protein
VSSDHASDLRKHPVYVKFPCSACSESMCYASLVPCMVSGRAGEGGWLGMEAVMREARDWLLDCFDDCPAVLADAEVRSAVRRHYVGGWRGFVVDSARLAVVGSDRP